MLIAANAAAATFSNPYSPAPACYVCIQLQWYMTDSSYYQAGCAG